MNKHIAALKRLLYVLVPALYLTVLPAEIVKYGISNNMPSFDNGAPFYEVYSVFSMVWIGGHLIGGVLLFSLYMLCYGCHKKD